MWSDIKKIIGTVAPTVGAMIGGPIGGGAASLLCEVFGISEEGKSEKELHQELAQAAKNMTPEQRTELLKQENEIKVRMAEIEVEDRASAREREIKLNDKTPAILSYITLIGFFAIIGINCFFPVDQGATKEILMAAYGTISMLVGAIGGYYFGGFHQNTKKH